MQSPAQGSTGGLSCWSQPLSPPPTVLHLIGIACDREVLQPATGSGHRSQDSTAPPAGDSTSCKVTPACGSGSATIQGCIQVPQNCRTSGPRGPARTHGRLLPHPLRLWMRGHCLSHIHVPLSCACSQPAVPHTMSRPHTLHPSDDVVMENGPHTAAVLLVAGTEPLRKHKDRHSWNFKPQTQPA